MGELLRADARVCTAGLPAKISETDPLTMMASTERLVGGRTADFACLHEFL